MRSRAAQLSLFAVALLSGLLLVGQLRSQARPAELSGLSAQELSALIETLSGRNRELRSGLANLRSQLAEYRLADSQGRSVLQVTEQELRAITAFGGLAPVEGQGVVLIIDGEVDAVAINDLIHELRNAGAEAIAVDDVRITASSVAVRGPSAIEIDGVQIGERFTMSAIGRPEGLVSTLERPGGIISQLEFFISAHISYEPSDDITVPATRLDLAPQVAQPVE